jgi:hypothetical protein
MPPVSHLGGSLHATTMCPNVHHVSNGPLTSAPSVKECVEMIILNQLQQGTGSEIVSEANQKREFVVQAQNFSL